MKHLSRVSVVAGLACCLYASPALAETATPDPGATSAPVGRVLAALQALARVVDAASAVSLTSELAATTTAAGPSGVPATSLGVESSNIQGVVGTVSAASFSSRSLSAAATSAAVSDSAAAPPSLAAEARHSVAAAGAPTADLSGTAGGVSSPLTATPDSLAATPVPIPAPLLLLGGGLLGIWPLRRSSRLSLEA